MKRDPSIQRLLCGDLLARSPLGYAEAREQMLEALFDRFPEYSQRDPRDPGIALLEALAATLEIFGFYHDRILTESKIGAAQLLQSVAQLGDIVGYTPRPALAAVARQFFEARAVGKILGGSKLAARISDAPGKVIFETLRAITVGPAFNRMVLDPIVVRHVGAMRAVLRRLAAATQEPLTPLDEFSTGALAMINGFAGLELTPIAGARSRAIAVGRPLRRSYGPMDARVHCATEYRHLRNVHALSELGPDGPVGNDDIVAFEVSARPILHIPDPAIAQRLRSTLEVYVFDARVDPDDPAAWTADRRWQEVPDFSASEAADHHYRTIADDRLCTYVLLRRRMGYRVLLRDDELDRVYVRFTPAVGDVVPNKMSIAPPELAGFVVRLDDDYFTSPLILPIVDGEPVRTLPSHWLVTDRSLALTPGRQIIVENADTNEKFVRTLGPRTLDQYLNWSFDLRGVTSFIHLAKPPPRPLWDRIYEDIIAPPTTGAAQWMKGLYLGMFGPYFPLDMPARTENYPVIPGIGVLHDIPDELVYIVGIPDRHESIEGWSNAGSLSISPLRSAARAGPYHLWEQFYRQFENLDWGTKLDDRGNKALWKALLLGQGTELPDEQDTADKIEPFLWDGFDSKAHKLAAITVIPLGATFIIVQDTSLIRAGDYFLLGTRTRHCCSAEIDDLNPKPKNLDAIEKVGLTLAEMAPRKKDDSKIQPFDPRWRKAEVLQAAEVQGKLVRLKWPTANEYTVDFLVESTSDLDQVDPDSAPLKEPITEIIVVPQVASVFFGETFRQAIVLSPDKFATDFAPNSDAPPRLFLKEVIPTLDAERLRENTEWTDNADFDTTWGEVFLASFADDPLPISVRWTDPMEPLAEGYLRWQVFVRVDNEVTQDRISRVFVSAKLSLTELEELVELTVNFRFTRNDHYYEITKLNLPSWIGEATVWAGLKSNQADQILVLQGDGWQPIDQKITVANNTNLDLTNAILEIDFGNNIVRYVQVLPLTVGDVEISMEFVLLAQDVPNTAPVLIRVHAIPATIEPVFIVLGLNGVENFDLLLVDHKPDPSLELPEDLQAFLRYPRRFPPADPEIYFIERLASNDASGDYTFFDAIADLSNETLPGGTGTYYRYANKKSALDKARYKSADSEYVDYNFFVVDEVDYLMIAEGSTLLPGPFVIFSTAKALANEANANLTTAGGELMGEGGVLGEDVLLQAQLFTDSIVFNSGNFIPVRLGSPMVDHEIVANSLKIRLVVAAGFKVERDFVYADNLPALALAIKSGQFTYEPMFVYGFNKTTDGTFTLNFLFMGLLPATTDVSKLGDAQINIDVFYAAEIYHGVEVEAKPNTSIAEYTVCKDKPPVRWRQARFYQFETRPLPWNPLRQLVILNAADLKAGDFLFIDPSGVSDVTIDPCRLPPQPPAVEDVDTREAKRARDYIQWTRVVEVDGRMVMIDPPVKIQPRGFYHYRVTGYRRPPVAAVPDPDYYKLLQSEKTAAREADPTTRVLSFGDRLMLRPFREVGEDSNHGALVPIEREWLLDHLVPGDRLLVWDERWRDAWHGHRVEVPHEKPWHEWPDRQHEVVIKRIVPRLGLVELELRMPPRFGVEYPGAVVAPDDQTFASVGAFRALPYYREPFQGHRELVAIGDGDRRVKFARFLGRVEATLGFASVSLDRQGTLASNVELFTVDRSAGEWLRWTEFTQIDDARAKDRAFVLGSTSSKAVQPNECVTVVLAETPETQEECCCREDDGEQALNRLAPSPAAEPTLERLVVAQPEAPRTELSVSFGDGVTGQLLPNGKANVFIRPVHVGRWCAHFQGRSERRVLRADQRCLPFRIGAALASAKNLALLVEHGAHYHWQPRAGVHRWNSSVFVEIDLRGLDEELLKSEFGMSFADIEDLDRTLPKDRILQLREVSDAEAREGRDGVIVRPVRPGVVELFVAMQRDLAALLLKAHPLAEKAFSVHVKVFETPRTETWVLDGKFYDEVLANDPTLHAGAGVVLLAETEGLAEGSLLGFDLGEGPDVGAEVVEVAEVGHATYSAMLTDPLQRVYNLDRSYLFGNLVEAVQGSSERRVLGSGDGATRNLRLALGNREPVLHSKIYARVPGELVPGVVVLVDDVPWERVESLEGRGPRDRVCVLEVEANGKCHVRFGDGISGAIPAAGLDNIAAVVRVGDGARGNVPIGAIDRLLDGNLAVERTRNVTPGAGGKAADDAAQAREHLMTRTFTHGRAVTRDDVIQAIRALTNVVQAALDPSAPAGVIRAVVALADRQPATDEILAALAERISGTTPVAADVVLEFVAAVHVGVHVVLEISVNPGFFEGEVVEALERAFAAQGDGFFALERWPLGAPLRVGDIYEHAFASPGVATARVRWLARSVEPMELPASTSELLRVAPDEVVRCDSDRSGDPYRARGSFRVQIKRGGK